MKRKNLLSYFGLAVCVITAVLLLTIPSCDSRPGTGSDLLDEGMQTALFGYDTNNYFFIQNVTEKGMGSEMYSGKWHQKYHSMTSFTMEDGRQFIFGHHESGYWFIQEILKTGDLGFETDSDHWQYYYPILSAFRIGDNTYIYGQKPSDGGSYWFIQEILPGGTLGPETDNGHWKFWYETGLVTDQGGHVPLLFGQKESGYWFIQDVSGVMGGQTDAGSWKFYYDTVAPFYINGRTFLFLQKESTGYWNIMEVLPGGKMGSQIGPDGHWHHRFDFVFPMLVNSEYLSTVNWMTRYFDLIKDRSLNEIAIPGSHDAGMSLTQRCNGGNACDTQTQVSDFYHQLIHGTRFLDLRPVWLDDEHDDEFDWYTGHFGKVEILGYVGCMGQTLDNALFDIKVYLKQMHELEPNHKELVIVNFSHCYSFYINPKDIESGRECNDQEWNDMIDKSWEILSQFMLDVPAGCNPVLCPYEQLMQGGGHVIFLVDHDKIKTGYKKGIINVDQFKIYNDYSNTNNFSYMRDDQYTKLRKPANHKEKLFLLSWTLTLSEHEVKECWVKDSGKLLDLAIDADNKLVRYIMQWVKEGNITKTYFPNIVYVDRFGPFATRAAIYLNQQYATLQP